MALIGDDLAELAGDGPRRPSAPTWSSPAVPRAARRRELLADRPTVDGQPAAYVCESFTCKQPVTDCRLTQRPALIEMQDQCEAPSSPSPPVAARSGSSSRSGSRRSSSPPARPTCRTSSKTPKATRRPPTCPAAPNRPRALKATESLQKGEIAPAVIVYRRDSGLTAADQQTIDADVGKMTDKALPGRDPRRRHGSRRRWQARTQDKAPDSPPKGLPPRAAGRRPARSRASPPTTPPSSARSARRTARRRSSPPTSRATARANGSSTRSSTGATRSPTNERRSGSQDHRRRRLLGRRDRSLRRHQRHAAAGRAQPGDLPADRDLPLADVLPDPADRRWSVRGDALALARLRADRARA